MPWYADVQAQYLTWTSEVSFLSYYQHVHIHVLRLLGNANLKKKIRPVTWEGWSHDKFYMTSYVPKRIQKRDYLTLKHEVHSLSHKKTKLKGALSGLRQFLAIASQLKMMRNAFYFTLKALFVLEIFQILFWVFGYVGIQHDERAKVNFKISYVSNWIKTITIHMLPDISRSQGNLTTKFVPLIEYDIRNFLVEKSCTKCGGQSFFKRWKLNIFLEQQFEILYSLFCCMSKSRTTKTYWNWVTNHLFFIHIKLFSKTERGLKLVSMSHFQHDIWRKYLYSYVLVSDLISFSDCFYFLRYLVICWLLRFMFHFTS